MDSKRIILELLDEQYSPYIEVQLTTRLVSDIGLDSLDINNIMSDLALLFGITPSAREFRSLYGIDPTVSQLVEYVRTKQLKHPPCPMFHIGNR